jgi:hypothetical protein
MAADDICFMKEEIIYLQKFEALLLLMNFHEHCAYLIVGEFMDIRKVWKLIKRV